MMTDKYILALDQGTTHSRAILCDKKGHTISIAQKEIKQIYPKPGWVEHDPQDIWATQIGVAVEAVTRAGAYLNEHSIAAIGITNQRETTIVWDRKTGEPIYNAIVWQDRRTAAFCEDLKEKGLEPLIRAKTGLVIDSYFSASKLKWILDHVEGARQLAAQGRLAFGTVDTWLIWQFTKGKLHITDVSNASRTMLFNIHTLTWDDELLELLDIPRSVLPEVRSSSEIYGHTQTMVLSSIPLASIAGDQQAALFGQLCLDSGMVKNTYGTGCFIMMNTGTKPITSNSNLLTTIAWQAQGTVHYALEGSIFIGGAVVQWLRDGLGFIKTSQEVEKLALTAENTDGVYIVPAFTGLGAPHWNPHARGTIFGATHATTAAHLARASLNSIAYQTMDALKAMEMDSGIPIQELRVDGGAAANNLLMQFQSDILNIPLVRPQCVEATALGVAYLAGLAVGYWSNLQEIKKQRWAVDTRFEPSMSPTTVKIEVRGWKRALKAAKVWADS